MIGRYCEPLALFRSLVLTSLLAGLAGSALAGKTYADHADGTVTDPTTGLTWMRCAVGQIWTGSTCTGNLSGFSWEQARALTSNFAGRSDWRLPNIRELQTLVDRSRFEPAADVSAFPNSFWNSTSSTTARFWSGAPDPSDSNSAWRVNFYKGDANRATRATYFFVRLVRGTSVQGIANDARPTSDYLDHADGTVTHVPTGLMWKRCSEPQTWEPSTHTCSGAMNAISWDTARQLSPAYAGKTDWRLPTEDELLSLVDYSSGAAVAINLELFPNTPPSFYFSNDPVAGSSSSVWGVNFDKGYSGSTFGGIGVSMGGGGVRYVRNAQYSQPINLTQGWNLFGNSQLKPVAVTDLFSDPFNVISVWKWDVAASRWQFYTPTLGAEQLQSYVSSRGFGVLSVINPGEGYWVNAKVSVSLGNQTGIAFNLAAANLLPGWNLVATGGDLTPSAFNLSLNLSPPAAGVVPLNVTSLWAWNSALSQWYFYAPSLEAQGGTALTDYITSKSYLDFTASSKTLMPGTGFWVNKLGGN